MTISRKFKGVWIPAAIWTSKQLTWMEKCVIAEIDSLSDEKEPCIASDEYLATMFDISVGRMSNIMSKLRKLKAVETVSFDGRVRKVKVNSAFTDSVNPELTDSVNPQELPNIQLGSSIDTRENRGVHFSKPSLETIKLQGAKIGLPDTECEKFFYHYESNGWKVGKSTMRCLNSALSGWKLRWQENKYGNNQNTTTGASRFVDRNAGTANAKTIGQYDGVGKVPFVPNQGK